MKDATFTFKSLFREDSITLTEANMLQIHDYYKTQSFADLIRKDPSAFSEEPVDLSEEQIQRWAAEAFKKWSVYGHGEFEALEASFYDLEAEFKNKDVFKLQDGRTVRLSMEDMSMICEHYEIRCTAEYIEDNLSTFIGEDEEELTRDQIHEVATEARHQMNKYGYDESEAIEEAFKIFRKKA